MLIGALATRFISFGSFRMDGIHSYPKSLTCSDWRSYNIDHI